MFSIHNFLKRFVFPACPPNKICGCQKRSSGTSTKREHLGLDSLDKKLLIFPCSSPIPRFLCPSPRHTSLLPVSTFVCFPLNSDFRAKNSGFWPKQGVPGQGIGLLFGMHQRSGSRDRNEQSCPQQGDSSGTTYNEPEEQSR